LSIADKSRIGIASPHIFPDGKVDMELVRRYVRRAEELGYSSLWTQERITGRPTAIDPVTFLSYIAGQTTTARIGVSVLVLPRHNPIHLAKQMASIDQLSGGRLIVGVGLGGNANDLLQYGIPTERRVRRFVEHIVNIEPKPVQKPHPPLWFGAGVEASLRRAVRYGDGWMGAGSSGRDSFERNLVMIKGLLADEGRTQAEFPISKRIYLAVDDDEARALKRLREWSGYYYGSADLAERVGMWGSAARVQEQLAVWSEAGVDEFLLNPVFDMEMHLEKLAEITGLS